jgi:hypothetical protein
VVAGLSVHLLAAPELEDVGPRLLYTKGSSSGLYLTVRAAYLPETSDTELLLRRADLSPVQPPVLGSPVASRPVGRRNVTHASFLVPQGLQSGLYAVSLRFAATNRSSTGV